MAVQVKLVRREDQAITASDISSISLLSNTDGFDLEYYDGWTQTVPQGMTPGNLTETFNLIAKGTSHDNLASKLQGMDDKLKETEWYWDDPTERYGVWLRAQLTGETYARQALIRRGEGQPGESFYGPYVDRSYTCRRYALALERLPWWEDTSIYPTEINSLSFGGNAISHGTIKGDIPARPAITEIEATTALDEFWLGFRTARLGTVTNFQVTWDCEDGTMLIADTTAGGTYTTTTFATDATMASRFYVKISDVTANYSDQRGQFIVLLRAQLSAGSTTTRVRLLDGYSTSESELRRQDRVAVDDTNWKLYSLGTIQIPPLVGMTTENMFRSYRLLIQAERTSGAGNLRCDKFILIPISEGALYVSNVSMDSSTYKGRIHVVPEENVSGWAYSDANATIIAASMAPRPQGVYGFSLPIGAGYTIFAGQDATSHDDTATASLTINRSERWRTLRGNDKST